MSQKLIDRMASASFVYGLIGATTFSVTTGNPMSGNIVVLVSLAIFGVMYSVEVWARSQ